MWEASPPPDDISMAYQRHTVNPLSLGQGVKGSFNISGLVSLSGCSDGGEAAALGQLLQTLALDEHHHMTEGGADFDGVALLGGEGEEGGVVGGFDEGHLRLEVVGSLPMSIVWHTRQRASTQQAELLRNWRQNTVAPLLTHRCSDTLKSSAALLPSVRPWRH